MKFELALIRAGRTEPIDRGAAGRTAVIPTRKAIRESTDALIFEGLQSGDMPALVRHLSATMLTVARAVDEHDFEPGVDDFIAASMSLIEASRGAIDLALVVNDWDGARAGAVMLEITVRGICAALGIDYEAALRAVHEGREPPAPATTKGTDDGNPRDEQAPDPAAEAGRDTGLPAPEADA